MRATVVSAMVGGCLLASVGMASGEVLKTEAKWKLDEVNETAGFWQIVFPATPEEARKVVASGPRVAQKALEHGRYAGMAAMAEPELEEALKDEFEKFGDEARVLMRDNVFRVYASAELGIKDEEGEEFQFHLAEIPRGAGVFGTNAEALGALLPVLEKLAGPDTPISFATIVVDNEVCNLLGIGAWLPRKRKKTFALKPDLEERFDAYWRFEEYPGGIVAEVRCDLTKEQVRKIWDVSLSEVDPDWGLLTGYDVGNGQRPLYIGLTRRIAGRVSLTAGGAFGGGQSEKLGFGISFEIQDILGAFTEALGGKKQGEQGSTPSSSETGH